jgi:hypothetical protein
MSKVPIVDCRNIYYRSLGSGPIAVTLFRFPRHFLKINRLGRSKPQLIRCDRVVKGREVVPLPSHDGVRQEARTSYQIKWPALKESWPCVLLRSAYFFSRPLRLLPSASRTVLSLASER